ncbi:MAG: SDR family NAD(P)-dependent oxidoreductase, partial [Acidimicrobiaceae bacterium]|nr:SDR family NAD(P)-dependent oxidoreductase [Acidimicrobiaceae bacterium]
MIRELQSRVAVVTGAASGIGRALATALCGAGCAVALADVDALDDVVKELDPGPERPAGAAAHRGMSSSPRVLGVSCDVRSSADLRALRNVAVETFGPVDVVCLNAGVSPSGPVLATTEATWRWLVDVNLLGVANGLGVFGPELLAKGEGHIVITASVTGLVPTPSLGPYSAVKHAVVALAEVLRHELDGSGVDVSVLCPGVVRTRIHESERNRPADLAGPTHTDPGVAARYRDAVEASVVTPDLVAEAALAA